MLRSTALLATIVLAAAAGVAGCGSSDDESSAPPSTPAAQPAPKAPAAGDRLDAADAAVLRGVRKTVAQYCASHKATAGELTGAIATLESLYEVDPAAKGADGKSVKQVAVATQRRLRICGARSAAKRVGKLTG
jgi:hypothetical protein